MGQSIEDLDKVIPKGHKMLNKVFWDRMAAPTRSAKEHTSL
jgi:hypothetical protein